MSILFSLHFMKIFWNVMCLAFCFDCVLCVCLPVDVCVCVCRQVCRCAYRCILSIWRRYQVSSLITHHYVYPHKDCYAAWSSSIRLVGLPISRRGHLFSSSTILSSSHVLVGDPKTVPQAYIAGILLTELFPLTCTPFFEAVAPVA